MWSREVDNIQSTTRPDHVWPEVWTKIGKTAQSREKQEWAKEKPKLDNAPGPRGSCFIDPDDKDFKETLKNARRRFGKTYGSRDAAKVVAKPDNEKEFETMCDCTVDSL